MKLVSFSTCSQFKMKALTLAVFSLILYQTNCHEISSKNSLVSYAINGILQEYFAKTSPKIDLIHVHHGTSVQSENLIKSILRNKNDSCSFKVSTHTNFVSPIKLNASSIIIFDSVDSFRIMRDNIYWQTNKAVRYKHLVYFPEASRSDLELIQFNLLFKYPELFNRTHRLNEFSIDTVNFLTDETEKSIELVTSFMFTSQACRKNQFLTINRFEKDSMKWNSSIFYPNKYRNLFQCELNYFRSNSTLTNKSLEVFARLVNSTPIILSKYGDRKSDLAEKMEFHLNFKPSALALVSNPYAFGQLVFLIPPGGLYTPLEKMLAPFEKEVWIGIAVTLVIGFATVQVINFADSKVQKFVFGRTIKSPTMNFISIFFNGSQVKTAGRNFARFIFMLFVIWCFVIRTCYQSKLFESLQSDKRKPEIKTINGLFSEHFKFCYKDFTYIFIVGKLLDNTKYKSSKT
jgi:hypothetical protein